MLGHSCSQGSGHDPHDPDIHARELRSWCSARQLARFPAPRCLCLGMSVLVLSKAVDTTPIGRMSFLGELCWVRAALVSALVAFVLFFQFCFSI
mmetsp:Transcript_45600/g.145514  ORF Transcript_45600/g.145514 Transcript_45600/m.145514 type:complete len:94 (+) Transcript_45600:585-866(+)